MSQRPVVQRSQYRLGFRWRGQIADEGDLDNCKHPDNERDGGADLRADRGSRGHDSSVYEYNQERWRRGFRGRVPTRPTRIRFPTRCGRGRAAAGSQIRPPWPDPARGLAATRLRSVCSSPAPGPTCCRPVSSAAPADACAPRSALSSALRWIARAHPCRVECAGGWSSRPRPGWPNLAKKM